MSGPLVELAGVSKSFGSLEVIRGLDLQVSEGRVAALAGGNGAGKSTLLRILATLVLADTGLVRVAGYDVATDGRLARKHTGVLLTEERSWYWRLSGSENLRFFGALHGLAGATARSRIDGLLGLTGLTSSRDRPVGTYSSGMRMRLALARALLGRPRVLLLDEPTRSADAEASHDFRELVRSLTAEGVAVIFASHDAEEIIALTSDVTILTAGQPSRRLEYRTAPELRLALRDHA